MIPGPVGRLEALLEEPEDGEPRKAALVCHPHPLHGGTMHNKVVYRLARGLRSTGSVVLRFNFRGVNMSEGAHAHGTGEIEDARVALEWLRERYPDLPYTLAGFSFGGRTILTLGCSSAGAERLIVLGYPTSHRDSDVLDNCTVPKIFIHSTNDQYGPRPEIEALVGRLPEPKRLILIDASDHFFKGALDQLEEAIKSLD
jgi:alpha/beta superfamily hydrolase